MNILGIETSCDETSAAIVKDGRVILSNVVVSSLREHSRYGGIIPEIASRRQIELINLVTKEALHKAGKNFSDISRIAVTVKPGLVGSLLVGVSFAKSLGFALKKPVIEVDHIQAHLYANFLTFSKSKSQPKILPKLPAVGLVVSGGHSSLFYVKDFRNLRLLGQTRDDAVGESFDKVARMLNLGYPGGPVIDRLAKTGVNNEIHFPCATLPGTDDFSFSGIKTSVLYYLKKHAHQTMPPANKIAYSFQKSVITALIEKCKATCLKNRVKTLLIGGGVAANSALRERMTDELRPNAINVHFPDLSLCLDNAAMIAGLGYHYAKAKICKHKP